MLSYSSKQLTKLLLLTLSFCIILSSSLLEASVRLAWDPVTKDVSGAPITNLAGYKIYYDSDRSGAPYTGTGLTKGGSPITLPLSSFANPSKPEFLASGLTPNTDYYVVVTAYSWNGSEGGYSNQITIHESRGANVAPKAAAGPDTIVTRAQLAEGSVLVTLDGASSSDPDGDTLSYSWKQTQGNPVILMGSGAARPFFVVTSSLAGQTLAFQLTVSDGRLESSPDAVLIHVESLPSSKNAPPDAQIVVSKTQGVAPLMVHFTGIGTDADGTIVRYIWTFGDGKSVSVQNPEHVYTRPGDYTVLFGVMDNDGAMGITTATISVAAPASDQKSQQDGTSDPVLKAEPLASQDRDQDGIADRHEIAFGLDPELWDSDRDGISDFIEWGAGQTPLDSDGDGIIDALDTDSDNDGVPDRREGTGDDDEDGAPNYIDLNDDDGPLGDQDRDGINNSTEVTYMMNPNRMDSDGDGIDDKIEFGTLPWPLDSDGDGIINALDTDSDNDGKSDRLEGVGDKDLDGAANYIDIDDTDGPEGDQDEDGFLNREETAAGLNPNLSDSDQDGIPDGEEIQEINSPPDTDGDNIIDALDPDSDDDGAPDKEESREDMDRDGRLDRLDDAMATFTGKKERMALKLLSKGTRFSETKFLPDELFIDMEKPPVPFRHGGMQFMVFGVPVGGDAKIQVIIPRRFHKDTQYWKYDPDAGFFRIEADVSENRLTFTLTDGGPGDADHIANGIILDPGFISEPETESTALNPAKGGGGGGGCMAARNPAGIPSGLILFLPPLTLMILKRVKLASSSR